jgi:hypothetical protein
MVSGVSPLGRSGERLSALAYQAGEAVQFRHFHDELYGFDCAFVTDDTGTARCMPLQPAPLIYLDATCQTPAVREYGLSPGDWFVSTDGVPCPGDLPRGQAYLVGAQLYAESIVGSEGYVAYERTTAGCTVSYGRPKSNPGVHVVLPQAASQFVAGKIVSVETDSGLRVQRLTAEDGAEANLGVTLPDGTACTLQRDGSCVAVQGGSSERSCRTPRTTVAPSGAELLELGGAPLRLEVFALRGAEANRASFLLAAGQTGLFLTERGSNCSVQGAADGSLRCAENGYEVLGRGLYADETCRNRLYSLAPQPALPFDPAQLQYLRHFERGEQYRIDSVRSLKVHDGVTYFADQGSCRPYSRVGASSERSTVLALDETLPIESLPRVFGTRLE